MLRDYSEPVGRGGLAYSMLPSGEVIDDRRDFYSHAFVLLATSSYFAVTGASQSVGNGEGHSRFSRRRDAGIPLWRLRRRVAGDDSAPATKSAYAFVRGAIVALDEYGGRESISGRAGEMFGLFSSRFFREESGTLGEYFTEALEPAEGEAGELVEPGHHYE